MKKDQKSNWRPLLGALFIGFMAFLCFFPFMAGYNAYTNAVERPIGGFGKAEFIEMMSNAALPYFALLLFVFLITMVTGLFEKMIDKWFMTIVAIILLSTSSQAQELTETPTFDKVMADTSWKLLYKDKTYYYVKQANASTKHTLRFDKSKSEQFPVYHKVTFLRNDVGYCDFKSLLDAIDNLCDTQDSGFLRSEIGSYVYKDKFGTMSIIFDNTTDLLFRHVYFVTK